MGPFIDPEDSRSSVRFIVELQMSEIVSQLPPKFQELYELSVMGGMTISEMEEHLGLPRMTIHDRLQSMTAQIRKVIRNDKGFRLLFEALLDEMASRK